MKIAIVASSRTGSTWLYEILKEHLHQVDPDALTLEEFFNVEQLQTVFLPKDEKNFSATTMTIFPLKSPLEPPLDGYQLIYQWGSYGIQKIFIPFTKRMIDQIKNMLKSNVWAEYRTIESRERLAWLKKDPRKTVLLKVMVEDLEDNPELAEFVTQNFKIIFLKREDLVRQIQSYCLSMATGIWNSKEALEKINYQPFLCEKAWVDSILNQMSRYLKWRDKMKTPESQEVSYEQLCSWQFPGIILKNLGFELTGRPLPGLSRRLNPKPMPKYFSNTGQVFEWLKANRIAIITSPGTGSNKLYEILLDHQRQTQPEVFSLGEYLNIQSLREASPDGFQKTYQWGAGGIEAVKIPITPEMKTQLHFIEKMDFWSDFRVSESEKRVEWLRKVKHKSILIEVMAQDFEENPELAEFLTKNFKLIFFKREDLDFQGVSYSKVRAKMNGPQCLEVSREQLDSWGDPANVLNNLGFQSSNRLPQLTDHNSMSAK